MLASKWIRFLIISLLFWTFFLLASCVDKGATLSVQKSTETQDKMPTSVDERFTQYEGFDTCIKQAIESCAENDNNCIALWKDQCMMEAAAFTGDGSAVSCDQFLSVESKNNCLNSEVFSQAMQTRDVSLCKKLDGENLERCNREVTTLVAVISSDITACEALENNSDKTQCKNSVLMNQALQKNDASICDGIEVYLPQWVISWQTIPELSDLDNFEKQICIEQVEGLNKNISQ